MIRITRSAIESAARSPALHVLSLLALNACICRKLFVTEYTSHMGSIEAAYIGLSRWIMEHPLDLDWFPLWYGGIPFQNAYPPLLHVLVAVVAAVAGISPALSHHAVSAAMYALGPLTLYWLARRMSAKHGESFLAGLLYSLVSPSALLVPVIARDMGTIFGPRRLHALVQYGEGPHIMSMTLLPLAVIALDSAIAKRRPAPFFLAALALASVVLTNWLGAFALAAAVLSYLLATWSADRRRLAAAAATGLVAYAMAAPWIPPSTLAAVRRNAQFTVGHYPLGPAHVLYAILLLAALAAVFLGARRWRIPPPARFGLFFFVIMGGISLTGYWFGIYVMPQPERYHLEMEMGVTLAAASVAAAAWRRIPVWPRRIAAGALAVLALAVVDASQYRSRTWTQPIDIQNTVEYQVGQWFADHAPVSRIFTTGSIKFWHNAFTDTAQLGGGFDQGIVNEMIPRVTFGIPYTQGDGERCAMWMRAYGVDRIVVSGPETRDAFRDYRDAAKFAGVLPELWRSADDVIYVVPRRSASLAHVIRRESVVQRAPVNIEDTDPILAYHSTLEDTSLPVATLLWRRPALVEISTVMEAEQLLSVQVSYHPGWRALVNGQPRPVTRDGLGLMVIDTGCQGPCAVRLIYDGGTEMLLAKVVSAASVAGCGVWALVVWRRARVRR